MIYLVTGGAGFIGSHLIEKLIEKEVKIICIDDLSSGHKSNLKNYKNVIFINDSIQNINLLKLPEIDGVFHLAAQTSVHCSIDNIYESSLNNLSSTLKVFEYANKLKVPVVYASSSAVYGNLQVGDDTIEKYDILSPYALDKLTMEYYAKLCWDIYKTPSVGLRFFNVYGPRQFPTNQYSGVISIFSKCLLKNLPVTINGGYQTRDFIYVKDIVRILIKSMIKVQSQPGYKIFNVGTGQSISINALLSLFKAILNIEPQIINKDLPLGDPERSDGTFDKLTTFLNLNLNEFTNLKNGLKATIDFIKEEKYIENI